MADRAVDDRPTPQHDVDVLVVGAGFAGLYQLHVMRELGMSVRVLEAADGVGGTWYHNRYPGARCDVESMSYSYSFSHELEQEWVWTEKYPTQPEILRYLEHVADRFHLRRDISFGIRVAGAVWDERSSRWWVTTTAGDHWSASWLVMATGCLSSSKAPELPGVDRYRGTIVHTGHWPRGGVDLTGRVGVIGTGSTGIQVIPLVAEQARELTVFQRTPSFTMPARNRMLTPDEITLRKSGYRAWRDAQRRSYFGLPRERVTDRAMDVPDEERTRRYQAGWDKGELNAVLSAFTDTLTDPEANHAAAEFVRGKIGEQVTDPVVAHVLTPRGFPYGAKRPSLDTGYYATFNRDHVQLVDVRATPLVEITEAGLLTTEREYALDTIVFATGFDAMTGALGAIDIVGRGGLSLAEKWRAGPRTYLGLAVAGFPNLFTITGPLSPSVLSNMVVSIEQHVEWVRDAVAAARTAGVTTVEASRPAEDDWVEHVAALGAATLFSAADSWYVGANVPGKPRVFMAYVGGVGAYRNCCTEIADDGYRGFVMTRRRGGAQ